MTSSPLISIIVPVHNAELFLQECLDSIISQTHKNLEIIAVDDNSSDNSKKIIKAYQRNDPRIKYFYTNQHNAAYTRCVGIENATAKYVCFVDSDDIIHERYVEELYGALVKTGAKIASGKLTMFMERKDIKLEQGDTGNISIEDDLLAYFGNNYHSHDACRHVAQSINVKIFYKSILKSIDYSVLKTSVLEDNYIVTQILNKARPQKIALVDSTLYYYRQNPDSTMSTVLSGKIEYEGKEVSYPRLFDITMDYVKSIYADRDNIDFYIYKIKAQEYYNLALPVVDLNIKTKILEDNLDATNKAFSKLLKEREERIVEILNSRTYKVGKAILSPLRLMKKIIRKI